MAESIIPDWGKFIELLKLGERAATESCRESAAYAIEQVRQTFQGCLREPQSRLVCEPTKAAKEVWHFMTTEGLSACGSDYAHMMKTQVLENVTCERCKLLMPPTPITNDEPDSSGHLPLKTRGREVAEATIGSRRNGDVREVTWQKDGDTPAIIRQISDGPENICKMNSIGQRDWMRKELASLVDAEIARAKQEQYNEDRQDWTDAAVLVRRKAGQTLSEAIEAHVKQAQSKAYDLGRAEQREADAKIADNFALEYANDDKMVGRSAKAIAARIRYRLAGPLSVIDPAPDLSVPGPALDEEVARKVMGWTINPMRDGTFHPSTDIKAAMEVWNKMVGTLAVSPEDCENVFTSTDIPLAICLTALKAVKQ